MASPPPPVEDQARLLEDALAVVRQQAMLMRRCLETPGKLMDALKCRYVGMPSRQPRCSHGRRDMDRYTDTAAPQLYVGL
jgi:hypothetical protein